MQKKISSVGIIGCGVMGRGIAQRLISTNMIVLYDRNKEKADTLANELGAQSAKDEGDLLDKVEYFFLAVKPQELRSCADLLEPHLKEHHIALSIIAGVSLVVLRRNLRPATAIRIMPNLPIVCGAGVIGIANDMELSRQQCEKLEALLAPLGAIYWLPEEKMDALTSLTGSGPAFVCVFIEAMVDAGIAMGFEAEQARTLVLDMLSGSIELLQKDRLHPAALRWQISSPAGTTVAGVKELEKYGVRYGIIAAFEAAYARSRALNPS